MKPTRQLFKRRPARLRGARPISAALVLISTLAPHTGLAADETGHGSRAQGGLAPPDARDPNAWSDGLKRNVGPYALPGTTRLRTADEQSHWSVMIERLEWQKGLQHGGHDSGSAYEGQLWWGHTYNRATVKAEGDYTHGAFDDTRTELMWTHAFGVYWDTQLGVRHDTGAVERNWLAIGIQGLAPWWFDVEGTVYVGNSGRTALRLKASYDTLITQNWALRSSIDTEFRERCDPDAGLGAGLNKVRAGLRLRYEFTRRFAPYAGIEWNRMFGGTAERRREDGENTSDTRFVMGLMVSF